MGTRGMMGFVVDGAVKGTYNHYDSYFTGLGKDVGAFVATLQGARLAEYADKARAMVFVDEQTEPTDEQREALAEFADFGVSTGRDWYSLLRLTQGDLEKTLDCGLMPDNTGFAYDSLMCEYAYLANFDTGMLEVYVGFQQGAVEGRFSEPIDGAVGPDQGYRSSQYSPVTLLGQLPFPLAGSAMFWEQLEAAYSAHRDAVYEAEDGAEPGYTLDFGRLAGVVGQIESGVLPE